MKRTIEILLRLVAPPARLVALLFAVCAAGGAWAAITATEVWEAAEIKSNYDSATGLIAGHNNSAYKLNVGTGLVVDDSAGAYTLGSDGSITINSAASHGVTIDLAGKANGNNPTSLSILVKYRSLSACNQASLISAFMTRSGTKPECGLIQTANNALTLKPYWYIASDSSSYSFDISSPSVSASGGYALFSYDRSTIKGYTGSKLTELSGGTASMSWTALTFKTAAIGGSSGEVSDFNNKWPGMVIEKIALFVGNAYTSDAIATYYFPSDDPTALDYDFVKTISSNTALSEITSWDTGTGTPGAEDTVHIVCENSAVLTIDTAINADTLWVQGGSVTLANGASITANMVFGSPITVAASATASISGASVYNSIACGSYSTLNISNCAINGAITDGDTSSNTHATLNITDCVIIGGITAGQNNSATINTAGAVVFRSSADNHFKYSSTLNVNSGTTTYNSKSDRKLWCTINVAKGATLVNSRSDSFNYDASANWPIHAYIRGTLTLNQKWTVAAGNYIHLYDDAVINGSANIHANVLGSQAKIVSEKGTSTITAPVEKGNGSVSVQTKDGTTLVLTSSTELVKSGAGTLQLKDVAWTGAVSGSEGTVEVCNTRNTAHSQVSASGITFSGKIKFTAKGTYGVYVTNKDFLSTTVIPQLELDTGTSTYNKLFFKTTFDGVTTTIRDLMGSGGFTAKDSYSVAQNQTFISRQTQDTEFSGVFLSEDGATDIHKTNLIVEGDGSGNVNTLKLSGANTSNGELKVRDDARVLFSSTGSWMNGTVTVADGGVLESQNSAAVAATLTLQNGATMTFVPNKMVTVTTLNLPSGEGETVTFDINYVPALEGTTLISSSSITANTDVSMIKCENAIIKAEAEAIKAYPVATVTTSGSGAVVAYSSVQEAINNASAQNDQYVTAYQSETVTAAGVILLKIADGAVVTLNSSRAGYAYGDGTHYSDGIYVFSDSVQVAATFKWKTAVASGSWGSTDNWTSDDGTVSRMPGSLDTVIFESAALVETPASGFSFAALQANASVTIKREQYAIREGLTRTVSAYGAISGTGSLTLNDGVNLANASDASLSIGVPVTVAGATALTVAEGVAASFTGSGTLTLDALTSTSIVGDGWTGTVWLKNINSGNIVPANYGNANSVIKFTGVTGEIPTGTTCSSIIELVDDGATKALTIDFTSASAFNTITLSELKGDGTFALKSTAGYYPRTTFKISKWDAFEGSLSVDRGRIQFGNDAISNDEDYLHIRISSGASVDVATGKTWSATQGFRVYGTLNAVTPDNLTGKLVGSGRVGLGSLRSSAFTFDNWTGTVVLPAISSTPNQGHRLDYYGKAGSTIEIDKGFSGWLSAASDDSRNVKAAVRLSNSSSMTITGSNSGTTYGFAKLSGNGNFTFSQTYQPSSITIGILEDYTGTIANTDNDGGTPTTVTITKIILSTPPSVEQKLVSSTTPDTVSLSGVYVGETQQDVLLEKKSNGIYVAATVETETVGEDTVKVLDTGSNTAVDASSLSGKVAIPGTVAQITGVAAENLLLKVTYTPDGGDSTTGYYAGILTLDASGNVSLDGSATVNDVKVQPTIGESATVTVGEEEVPATALSDSGAPSFAIKTIPGLWYAVKESTDASTFTAGTPVQATSAGTLLSAEAPSSVVKYYKIAVGASRAALQ